MMRFLTYFLTVLFGFLILVLVIDFSFKSDEEKIENFINMIEKDASSSREDALENFIDCDTKEVLIDKNNERRIYEDDGEALEKILEILGVEKEGAKIIQSQISVKKKKANLAFRLRAENGLIDAKATFIEKDQNWILAKIKISERL